MASIEIKSGSSDVKQTIGCVLQNKGCLFQHFRFQHLVKPDFHSHLSPVADAVFCKRKISQWRN